MLDPGKPLSGMLGNTMGPFVILLTVEGLVASLRQSTCCAYFCCCCCFAASYMYRQAMATGATVRPHDVQHTSAGAPTRRASPLLLAKTPLDYGQGEGIPGGLATMAVNTQW